MEIAVQGLTKCFSTPGASHQALAGVTLAVGPGEMVALIGPSGSGKSTLLRTIAGLLTADAGRVCLRGRDLQRDGRISPDGRAMRADVGVIFQQFNLVNRLTVETNVLAGMIHSLPWWRSCLFRFTAAERQAAHEALLRVGLADRARQRADTLSGGQQQRAAIARALVQRARIVLGDEPIASLDPHSARRVLDTLARINREDGVTCLVSLHQVEFALGWFPRVIALAAGRVVYDGPSAALDAATLARIYGEPVAAERPLPTPRPLITTVAETLTSSL